MTIINFMPVYRQAPVSLRLLEERLDEAVERAASEDVTLILPKGRTDLASRFGEGKVVLADETIGFLYGNDTAAAKLLSGEKPVPSSVTGAAEDEVVSGEAWLCGQDGTKRVWLEGANDPVEVDATTTVAGLLSVAAVPTEGLRAVYLGYPQSRFLVPGELDEPMELSCDYMCVYTDANCMANALREIATTFHRECCGRCVFGYEGGYQLETILGDAVGKRGRMGDLDLMRDLCPTMSTQSLCELGRIMARTVQEGIDLFGDELDRHVSKRSCPAGECKAFMTYHILVSRCTGCGDCLAACEEDAITGKDKFVHVIDQKACIQCGRCLEACGEGAVVMAGARKPKTPPRPIPCKRS